MFEIDDRVISEEFGEGIIIDGNEMFVEVEFLGGNVFTYAVNGGFYHGECKELFEDTISEIDY